MLGNRLRTACRGSGRRHRDVAQQSDASVDRGVERGCGEAFAHGQGRIAFDRHGMTQPHAAGFEQAPAARQFGFSDQTARGEQVEMIGEVVLRKQPELRLAVQALVLRSFDDLRTLP